MGKKTGKDKKPLPPPMGNRQIAISQIRKLTEMVEHTELEHAREYPILGCWLMAGWQATGITPVVVAREQSPGKVMFGCYMVDLYLLGVKDAFTRLDFSMSRFERELPRLCADEPEKCSVELAHEIIYGGLEYAEKYGFEPHPDFKFLMADLMLDPPDAHPRVDGVVFGKDGKPFYVSGPHDDERKISSVLATLRRTSGDGKFNFLTELGKTPDLFEDEG